MRLTTELRMRSLAFLPVVSSIVSMILNLLTRFGLGWSASMKAPTRSRQDSLRSTGVSLKTSHSCRVKASTPCSIVFNRFVNKVRLNKPLLAPTYTDHEQALMQLYALDQKVWEVKVS